MIELNQIEQVFVARMARTIWGHPIYFTASYYVDGLLVDSGPTVLEREFLIFLRDKTVRVLVNTHHHEDHIGNNAVLQKRFGMPIYAFSLALPTLANPSLLNMALYRRLTWGVPPPSRGLPVGRALRVNDHPYQIFYTPGHSEKDITLFEPNQRWAFTGDLFVRGRDVVFRRKSNAKALIKSLEFLKSLQPRILFPGSGHPVLNPGEELEKKLAYLYELKEKIVGLYRSGASMGEIKKRLFHRTPLLARISAGDYSAENLIRTFVESFA